MKIGIFDSGIGGLTVLNEIMKVHPNNEYYYFGDNINVPYGTKNKEELKILVDHIIKFLLTKQVDIIIIACGTVSSTLYNELDYNLPIYDVISSTISYVNDSNYKKIGVIATSNTIKSNIFNERINKEVVSVSCPLLASYIEKDLNVDSLLKEYLKSVKNVDALVLGCTHYPIIKRQIKEFINVPLIDMGKILSENIYIKEGDHFKLDLYFTKVDETLKKQISNIINEEYSLFEVK